MEDFQLYQQILGLSAPWRVQKVVLKRAEGELEIEVACEETDWGCPECHQRMRAHDTVRRRWRHLDSCQFHTMIVCDVPAVLCPEHGAVTVAVPWAEKFSRMTRLMERLAIDLMLECSIQASCQILGLSWDEADGVKQRAVARGLARKPKVVPPRVCVDEKSFARGQSYVTVVAAVSADQTTVEQVEPGRAQASLETYWRRFPEEQLDRVPAVAMDMWAPFLEATRACVPGADDKICHDPFHLVAHMNQAVNDVRKAEHREQAKQGDQTLAGTRQWWLYGQENVPEAQAAAFDQIKFLNLRTARAWGLKEVFRSFWLSPNRPSAQRYFQRWYSWAIRSRLAPVKKVARMCQKHLHQILNYFDHRLTNGPIEGLNNKIQGLIKKAYGYRNQQRFINDIYFHCGGLDLHPAQ